MKIMMKDLVFAVYGSINMALGVVFVVFQSGNAVVFSTHTFTLITPIATCILLERFNKKFNNWINSSL